MPRKHSPIRGLGTPIRLLRVLNAMKASSTRADVVGILNHSQPSSGRCGVDAFRNDDLQLINQSLKENTEEKMYLKFDRFGPSSPNSP